MSVIVDTSVWSAALRRSVEGAATREAAELSALIREGRAILLGPVRQELLSGIRSNDRFKLLREHLRAFPEFRLRARDYEEAASCFNRCRAKGIQGSNTDFLLCAVALERELPVYTVDRDFGGYAKVLRVKLHKPRA
jgi:predicted nucleic acid-binding protein